MRLIMAVVIGFFVSLSLNFWIGAWVHFVKYSEDEAGPVIVLGLIFIYGFCILIRVVTGRDTDK